MSKLGYGKGVARGGSPARLVATAPTQINLTYTMNKKTNLEKNNLFQFAREEPRDTNSLWSPTVIGLGKPVFTTKISRVLATNRGKVID